VVTKNEKMKNKKKIKKERRRIGVVPWFLSPALRSRYQVLRYLLLLLLTCNFSLRFGLGFGGVLPL